MSRSTTMRGGAIVLVVLLMMALSIFGVLSLVSAESDYKMARKSADWVRTYYKLENDGWHKLHQASVMARESGFYSLGTAGWEVDGSSARINLTEGVQNLAITIALAYDGSVSVRSWKQWREDFEYEDGGEDLWDIYT